MRRQLLLVNAILLLVSYSILTSPEQVTACGPGRAGARRRMPRKYPPLVQRQYIPNVSENTLGASGGHEGAIKRKDKRFKELVQNLNPDIEFRDDEQTGADRMMSQRLKEKLSTLAISVMNQWPNVKLRVIEGWDEDNRHSLNSLHYEGRAVDITTSDRDKSKYGMLARLAVEAGFDWVHYESRSHVHCSVKSERADTIRNNGCFDAKSLVETPNGQMQMSQLQINDQVLTMNSRGQLQFSPVIMWLDKDDFGQELFVELKTKSNLTIRLTSSHLIYVANELPLDLTQNHHQPLTRTTKSVTKQNTGNVDNNRNNYQHYYQTQNLLAQPGGVKAKADESVPSMTDSKPYNYVSSPTTAVSIQLAATFTTYARNVIVGQYLLVNPVTTPPVEHSKVKTPSDLDGTITTSTLNIVENDEVGRDKFLYNVDQSENQYQEDTDRAQSRLVFNLDKQQPNEDVAQRAKSSENLVSGEDGDTLSALRYDQIVSVNYVTRKGIYAPLTREGNIVVNSVVASCYAVINDHELAHLSFAPIRWLSYLNEFLQNLSPHSRALKSDTNITTSTREIHWYPSMLYSIARFILPTRYLY